MHAHGYSRRAKLECRYGCCTEPDAGRKRAARKQNDRAAAKAARRITPRLFTSLLNV